MEKSGHSIYTIASVVSCSGKPQNIEAVRFIAVRSNYNAVYIESIAGKE